MFAWHCRGEVELVSKLVLWDPKHGQRKPGRPVMTYVASLTKDTGLTVEEDIHEDFTGIYQEGWTTKVFNHGEDGDGGGNISVSKILQ